ncbi:MAG: cytochrome-c oxidase, cbb3-type subunit III [Gammaproteobacteria bacterium]|nr:cytochrome-c oxidase, cbb3-type subunit III [Gammaproteobacteria bacterium]
MADMPSDFWGGWIVVLTVTTLIALGWLVANVYFGPDDAEEIAAHTWDETLKEGTTPAPMWWFWLIFSTMIVSVVYLILYPGLGKFAGVLHWSQGHEIESSAAHYDERFGAERERIAAADVAVLRSDAAAMRAARSVFMVHCAACHGADAGGQAGLFPDLRDGEWQWGGDAAAVQQTIAGGRRAVMPPWQSALGDDGVEAVAGYVVALSAGRGDAPEHAEAGARFQALCSACHGPAGAGNALLGAPALNDDVWLYGGGRDQIARTIAGGRSGEMPAFGARLDATQIRLLTAWLAAREETATAAAR